MRWRIKGCVAQGGVRTIYVEAATQAEANGWAQNNGIVKILSPHWFQCIACRRLSLARLFGSERPCARCRRADARESYSRYRQWAISSIENGRAEEIETHSPVPLQHGEVARFCFANVEFWQERVVSREYAGSSSGASFHVARGVTYRVGSHRGHLISRTRLMRISTGALVLTSRRLIFSGDAAFSIPLTKILHMTPYANGLSVTKDSTAQNNRPFVFRYKNDPELMNLAVSACLNAGC